MPGWNENENNPTLSPSYDKLVADLFAIHYSLNAVLLTKEEQSNLTNLLDHLRKQVEQRGLTCSD